MSLTKQSSTNRHMRLAPWLLSATLSFGLATGCSSRTHPRDLRSARITLERTPCYGVCPVYTVTLDGNGLVQYFGNFRVDIPGPQTGKVGPNTLRDLLNLANQIGFFQMRDSYSEACTDMPTSIISILVDGKSKRVSNYYGGCEQQKSESQVDLARLAEKIDAAAGTDRWVNCDCQCLTNLIHAGLNTNAQSPNGDTPLLIAIQKKNTAKAALLLDAGANVELANKQGMTPLMWAVMTDQPSVVSELLRRGAKVSTKDSKGFTALEMAADQTIRRLLTASGRE